MVLSLPHYVLLPRVRVPDKKLLVNMNNYRNWHHMVSNQAKIAFKKVITDQIEPLPYYEQIALSYTLYPKTRRACDVSNMCVIVDKFFCDALVEYGKIPDDNYYHIPAVQYNFGNVCKENPRVDVEIINLKEE